MSEKTPGKKSSLKGVLIFFAILIGVYLMLSIFKTNEKPKPEEKENQLSERHINAIYEALEENDFPKPRSIEIASGGWLVSTFELDSPISSAYLENYATNAIIAIRNAMYPFSLVTSYRVTLEGPPPGPGLVLMYGSARFIEGGKVEWKPSITP